MVETSLPKYKSDFIHNCIVSDALKLTGDYSLKSKRGSPYFLNIGDFNSGSTTSNLAKAYASTIAEHLGNQKNLFLYGIPEKGVGFISSVSTKLWEDHKIESNWFFTRKYEKSHGESTSGASVIVGAKPPRGSKIVLFDDVFSTGETKYNAVETLNKILEDPEIVGLVIGLDRQEIDGLGNDAIRRFTEETKIPVFSIVKTQEVQAEIGSDEQLKKCYSTERISNYLRVYGTKTARESIRLNYEKIINIENCVIPACDVQNRMLFENLLDKTAKLDGIGGYKIGFQLGLRYGLGNVVEIARKYTNKPIIYDHQKAGTDIPDTGKNFMKLIKESGVDTVILFPQAGPETERAWIYRAFENELKVMVGGIMTHKAYLKSEGGFIVDEGALEMYRIAAMAGVRDFVVPATKPEVFEKVKQIIENEGIKNPDFYSPGFGKQGGDTEAVKKILGTHVNAIIGDKIYNAFDIEQAAKDAIALLR